MKAAHICGKAHNGSDDWRNGLPLCSTHHDTFDAHLFTINPETLAIETMPSVSPASIGIPPNHSPRSTNSLIQKHYPGASLKLIGCGLRMMKLHDKAKPERTLTEESVESIKAQKVRMQTWQSSKGLSTNSSPTFHGPS